MIAADAEHCQVESARLRRRPDDSIFGGLARNQRLGIRKSGGRVGL
jgi:hypothetical protein